jgi:hypothetical protein
VPLIVATATSLRGYGHPTADFPNDKVTIVTWPQPGWRPIVPDTGNEGGVVEDSFVMERRGEVQHAVNLAVGRSYITGWFNDPAIASEDRQPTDTTRNYTHEANYHPDGGQIFSPRDGAQFVALLAKPGDDANAVTPLSKRRKRLRRAILRIARREHHQATFALATHEHEAVLGGAFDLPTLRGLRVDRGAHRDTQIGVRFQSLTLQRLPLQIPHHHIARIAIVDISNKSIPPHGGIFARRRPAVHSVSGRGEHCMTFMLCSQSWTKIPAAECRNLRRQSTAAALPRIHAKPAASPSAATTTK